MGVKLSIHIYIFNGQVQRSRCNKLDTYVFYLSIRCREIGTAVGCIRIGTGNRRSIPVFSAMRSDNYNRLSLLSTGLVGMWHFRSTPSSLIKYFRNGVSFVLSDIVEQQVGYILFILVLPSEMYSKGSSPTLMENPPIPQKASSPSFWTLCHTQ